MNRWRVFFLILIFAAAGSSARAQDPSRIFGIIQNQLENEIARKQQQQFERQQQQLNQNLYNALLAAWRDCFDARILARCDVALQFANLSENDRQQLLTQREEIVAAVQAQQEQVRRDRADQLERERQVREQERQARIDAANEARRLQLEREQAATLQRQQELAAQRAQAETAQRLREAEEKRAAELRALVAALDACRRYDIGGCDRALALPNASSAELDSVRSWRDTAVTFLADRDSCRMGSIEACDRASASPAASKADHGNIAQWRAAASPINRMQAALVDYSSTGLATLQSIPTLVRELPLSTQITGGVATMLALTLAMVMVRRTPAQPANAPAMLFPKAAAEKTKKRAPWLRSLRRTIRRRTLQMIASHRSRAAATKAAKAAQVPTAPQLPMVIEINEQPRDTETAVDAMQLAYAYASEFHDTLGEAITDPAFAARTLNTLSLISRQLDIAERADPSATLTVDGKDGTPIMFNLPLMKGNALYYEATCRMGDNPKRAIQLFEQCLEILPDAANAHFLIGTLHAEMFNKAKAIEAFERAVALDPRNLDYRKELVRAQSISGSQIAYDRAVSGTKTTINVARWMWTGFVVIALIAFVSAIIRGDPGPAIAIFFIFMILGAFARAITTAKAWLGFKT